MNKSTRKRITNNKKAKHKTKEETRRTKIRKK